MRVSELANLARESLLLLLQCFGSLERRRAHCVRQPNVVALKLVAHAEVGNLKTTQKRRPSVCLSLCPSVCL